MHSAGREPAPHLLPEQRREIEADEVVEHRAGLLGVDFTLLGEVERINGLRTGALVTKIAAEIGPLEGKHVAVWGLAFKPDTDDLRDSPALAVAQHLSSAGATVRVFDPVAMDAARPFLPLAEFAAGPLEAAHSVDCVAICTEWPVFAEVDLAELRLALFGLHGYCGLAAEAGKLPPDDRRNSCAHRIRFRSSRS